MQLAMLAEQVSTIVGRKVFNTGVCCRRNDWSVFPDNELGGCEDLFGGRIEHSSCKQRPELLKERESARNFEKNVSFGLLKDDRADYQIQLLRKTRSQKRTRRAGGRYDRGKQDAGVDKDARQVDPETAEIRTFREPVVL